MSLVDPQNPQPLEGDDALALLPPLEEIPAEFKRADDPKVDRRTAWNGLWAYWFYNGLPADTAFYSKPTVPVGPAIRHVSVCVHSGSKVERYHKEAGCAYLMSLFFEKVESQSARFVYQ